MIPSVEFSGFTADPHEAPFSFEELFFSTTNDKGFITSGNSVFQRISQYGWDELINKPHKIIRHPDMPKGVFHVFWNFLKAGKPIAAYVKNRAKDGRYYWVFALALPVDGGYLSVRLKPSSELFPVVQQVYSSLLARELSGELNTEKSSEVLLSMLKEHGFVSYEHFMSVATAREILSRDIQLEAQEDEIIRTFNHLTETMRVIDRNVVQFNEAYEANKYVPINLQIQSSQLGGEGKAISVIAGNYDIVSTEMRSTLLDFRASSEGVVTALLDGQFLAGMSRMLQEMMDYYRKEQSGDDAQVQQMIDSPQKAKHAYDLKTTEGLQAILSSVKTFQEDCFNMKRCCASLEVIRIMGKVDSACISSSTAGINALLDELKVFQETISASLSAINRVIPELQGEVTHMQAILATNVSHNRTQRLHSFSCFFL